MALQINPECYQAFEKLIKNNLLVANEKSELIGSIQFTKQSLWLKDYYLSKIRQEINIENSSGFVKFQVSEEENMRIQYNEGVSPIRTNNVFDSDHNEMLRAPNVSQKNEQNISVVELLILEESADLKLIQAEQYFSEQKFQKCYQALKSIADEDPYFLDIIPLYCSVLIELGK